MNKTYAIIIILVVIVGAVFLIGKNKKLEAPAEINSNNNDSGVVSNTMSVPGTDTEEKIVTNLPPATETPVKEFTVSGQNFSFTPSSIKVQKGDKVKITFNNTSGFHDFKIDEYGMATKQTQSPTTEVLEFTADKVGSFEYYCSVGSHRANGMKGTLQVTE